MEEGRFVVRRPRADAAFEYAEEVVDVDVSDDGHGGGDLRLVDDFVRTVRGEPASRGTTRIEDSLTGHLIAFAADRAMNERCVVEIG